MYLDFPGTSSPTHTSLHRLAIDEHWSFGAVLLLRNKNTIYLRSGPNEKKRSKLGPKRLRHAFVVFPFRRKRKPADKTNIDHEKDEIVM